MGQLTAPPLELLDEDELDDELLVLSPEPLLDEDELVPPLLDEELDPPPELVVFAVVVPPGAVPHAAIVSAHTTTKPFPNILP